MSPSNQRSYSAMQSVLITLLFSLFVVLGMFPLLEAVTYMLPTTKTVIKIVDREIHEARRASAQQRGRLGGLLGYTHRLIIEYPDGARRKFPCSQEVYILAGGMQRTLSDITLSQSVLSRKPLAIHITQESLVNIPMLSMKGKMKTETYSLRMPWLGIVISSLVCWGIIGWMLWRLHLVNGFSWRILILGGIFAMLFGFIWWGQG